MFGFIGDIVEGAVDTVVDVVDTTISTSADILGGLVEGELPTSNQITTLIYNGMTVIEIAAATNLAENVIINILEDE